MSLEIDRGSMVSGQIQASSMFMIEKKAPFLSFHFFPFSLFFFFPSLYAVLCLSRATPGSREDTIMIIT